MAGFEIHFPIGIASGIVLATAGLHAQQLQAIEGIVVVALAGIGSCIPDIDCETSIPHRYFNYFLRYGLPLIVLLLLSPMIGSYPVINLFLYLFLSVLSNRYVCPQIKTITKHRGVLHTIAFGVLCSELTYLFFISDFPLFEAASRKMAVYFGVAVFVGHVSHLIVDEFYSLYDEKSKTFKKKLSFGSAFTMYSDRSTPGANVAVYILASLAALAIGSEGGSLRSLWLMIVNSY
jgi:hypothetical protein